VTFMSTAGKISVGQVIENNLLPQTEYLPFPFREALLDLLALAH
jgi:hypothetical protein